ncbi:uncharacterized protein SPAPADRAFT_64259 [Spathaspora passalidarum NRRL Y-27907]|uniref:Uncharacterized protein n=1 Tax=Spathaspora passalidarum (strain NRRL Y-27907 / 11-Y1) TaxID=619300 RepID=G3AFT0_SPAPN|nr:uncharacterized protein SPAPADRAFT_64259 [Spathaspora passalidarum NRRL Y-27907]EGW35069.1 hypothetical protein SPAPADRAFT_64259 [Spathaspora passalidarum NRRL Y-27907]
MVFFSIIRMAKYSAKPEIKLQFFQSSYPYFKSSYYYNNVIKYQRFHSNWWWKKYCSTRQRRFLTISNGHYGLYYTMYHHDAERRKQQREYQRYIRYYIMKHMAQVDRITYRQQQQQQQQQQRGSYGRHHFRRGHHCHGHFKLLILGFTALSSSLIDSQFENIKKFSSTMIASLNFKVGKEVAPAFVTPAAASMSPASSTSTYVSGLLSSNNPFASTSQRFYSTHTTFTSTAPRKNYDHIKVPSIVEFVKNIHTTQSKPVEPQFEAHFLQTQIDNITSAFNNFKQPQDLNIIYPLYQAIKRNELALPTVELYNIVLESIVRRSLDGESTLQAIESKLTNLLTVYQDILSTGLKPNKSTYNLVVDSLLDSSLKCVALPTSNPLQYQEIQKKSQEFVQITIELFHSISNQLDLRALLPKLFQVIGNYPELITESVLKPFIPLIQSVEVADKNYYLSVIEISKYFTKFNLLPGKEIYSIIESAYDKYKNLEDVEGNEFKVYEAVVTSLIYNNHMNKASQFLDDILLDYKESLQFDVRPTKAQIGNLIASFLQAVIAHTDVNRGYELFLRFSSIPYLPELPVSFYNYIICQYGQHALVNDDVYATLWRLYDHVAIRKDFQDTTTVEMMKQTKLSCRDLLLSITLARGDHERTFQLIKEIMLKNHLIGDMEILQKVLNYLYNGVIYNKQQGEYFNQYYFGLLWNLMESQALHYQVNSIDLNDFLCQFVIYLMINVPAELQHNKLAVQGVVDYNVKLLMNSPLVIKSVNMMDMQTDNLYGLVVISRQLMNYSGQDAELVAKIAEFQALLINQFEDAHNYYMELSDEVNEFKRELKANFANIGPQLTNPTSTVIDACHHLGIELAGVTAPTEKDVLQCDLDLSMLLNINYEKGVAKFLELFHQRNALYKFQTSTWRIIINFNFLQEVLLNQSQIKIDQFISRIWMCNKEDAIELMEQIVDFDIALINYHVALYLKEHNVYDTNLLTKLFKSCAKITQGKSKKVLGQEGYFASLYGNTKDQKWVVAYLEYLLSKDMSAEVIEIVDKYKLTGPEVSLLLLEADLSQITRFQTDFQRSLKFIKAGNVKLLELLIKYNLKLNTPESIHLILSQFAKYAHASPEIEELIAYTKLVNCVRTSSGLNVTSSIKSINHLAISILSSDSLAYMKQLYDANHSLVRGRESEFVTSMFDNLIKISAQYPVMNKYNKILKFMKLIDLDTLEVSHFFQILKLIKNNVDMLGLMVRRLINGGKFTDILNFYFMEVRLFDIKQKKEVLGEMYATLKEAGDINNVEYIEEFCRENGFKI